MFLSNINLIENKKEFERKKLNIFQASRSIPTRSQSQTPRTRNRAISNFSSCTPPMSPKEMDSSKSPLSPLLRRGHHLVRAHPHPQLSVTSTATKNPNNPVAKKPKIILFQIIM